MPLSAKAGVRVLCILVDTCTSISYTSARLNRPTREDRAHFRQHLFTDSHWAPTTLGAAPVGRARRFAQRRGDGGRICWIRAANTTPGRIRTCDLRFRKPPLYPLS